jgi:hypothetical protein
MFFYIFDIFPHIKKLNSILVIYPNLNNSFKPFKTLKTTNMSTTTSTRIDEIAADKMAKAKADLIEAKKAYSAVYFEATIVDKNLWIEAKKEYINTIAEVEDEVKQKYAEAEAGFKAATEAGFKANANLAKAKAEAEAEDRAEDKAMFKAAAEAAAEAEAEAEAGFKAATEAKKKAEAMLAASTSDIALYAASRNFVDELDKSNCADLINSIHAMCASASARILYMQTAFTPNTHMTSIKCNIAYITKCLEYYETIDDATALWESMHYATRRVRTNQPWVLSSDEFNACAALAQAVYNEAKAKAKANAIAEALADTEAKADVEAEVDVEEVDVEAFRQLKIEHAEALAAIKTLVSLLAAKGAV